MLRFILKFSTDSSLSLLIGDTEVLIAEILLFFSQESWPSKVEEICQFLSKPWPTQHTQNITKMIDAIPVSPRGLEFKSFWSVSLLHSLFQKESPKVVL